MRASKQLLSSIIVIGIALLVFWLGQFFYVKIDLTEDKRYTLTDATEQTIEKIEDVLFIRLLLDGEFPAGFRRLQTSAIEMLEGFKRINPNIEFVLDDPTDGDPETVRSEERRVGKERRARWRACKEKIEDTT